METNTSTTKQTAGPIKRRRTKCQNSYGPKNPMLKCWNWNWNRGKALGGEMPQMYATECCLQISSATPTNLYARHCCCCRLWHAVQRL